MDRQAYTAHTHTLIQYNNRHAWDLTAHHAQLCFHVLLVAVCSVYQKDGMHRLRQLSLQSSA